MQPHKPAINNVTPSQNFVKYSLPNKQSSDVRNIQSGANVCGDVSHVYPSLDTDWQDLLVESLEKAGAYKKAYRVRKCGTEQIYVCTHCGHEFVGKYACGLRTCPDCARKRANVVAFRFSEYLQHLLVGKGWGFRMFTLTTPFDVSKDNVQKVGKMFTKFMKLLERHIIETQGRNVWKRTGVVYSLEAGENGNKLHVHALQYGQFISWQAIRFAWLFVSDGVCRVTDIRAVKRGRFGIASAVRETLKYAIKGSAPADRRAGMEIALQGSRRMRTYGIFYRLERWVHAEQKDWKRICPVCGGTEWTTLDGLELMKNRAVEVVSG